AVQEADRSGGIDRPDKGRADGGREGHGLALRRGIGRPHHRGGGGRLVHRLVQGRRGAAGKIGIAIVPGGDQVRPGGQRRGGERRVAGAEGAGAEGRGAVDEGDRPGGRAGARGRRDRGRERHRLP